MSAAQDVDGIHFQAVNIGEDARKDRVHAFREAKGVGQEDKRPVAIGGDASGERVEGKKGWDAPFQVAGNKNQVEAFPQGYFHSRVKAQGGMHAPRTAQLVRSRAQVALGKNQCVKAARQGPLAGSIRIDQRTG